MRRDLAPRSPAAPTVGPPLRLAALPVVRSADLGTGVHRTVLAAFVRLAVEP